MTKFMTKLASTLVAASVVLIPVTPALARHQNYDRGYSYDQGRYDQRRYYANDRYDRGYYNQRTYDQRRYNQRNRYYRDDRCRNNGTTGTILGAIAGGLLGREVVGRRGDRTAGTIVGAGAGALAGRAIDRSDGRRC